jgi:3-phenylpropionate/cinnamic acid dioxygenase small subunit
MASTTDINHDLLEKQVTRFLYREARLLDEHDYAAWLKLFTEDGIYELPSPGGDEDGDSASSLFVIADNHDALEFRVERLLSTDNHSEFPPSFTTHVISNVEILETEGTTIRARCCFVTYRAKSRDRDIFFGHHNYVLKQMANGDFQIKSKRTIVSQPDLRPQGRVAIIL